MKRALAISGLTVAYRARDREPAVVVSAVDLTIQPGRLLGLAGESGSGKSTTALAALGFPIPGSVVLAGAVRLGDLDLLRAPRDQLRALWGRNIAYVAQDAALALSPLMQVGDLLAEPMTHHLALSREERRNRSVELLTSVGIPDPGSALNRYPHQFSGGQQQRIALAIALACEPEVLVLDEPTTGLDVTTQAQVSQLIGHVIRAYGAGALYVSHDLALLGTVCDELAIMYGGEIVEKGPAQEVYRAARHPYSAALLDAVPTIGEATSFVGIEGRPPLEVIADRCGFAERCRFVEDRCWHEHPELTAAGPDHDVRCLRMSELGVIDSRQRAAAATGREHAEDVEELVVRGLHCIYTGRPVTHAVRGVSLDVRPGEIVGVVGESGSGKSTLLRAIAGLHPPTEGDISFEGVPLVPRAVDRPRALRQAIQIVFQNPHASLNPTHTVERSLSRPLRLFRPELDARARRQRMLELLGDVRLDSSILGRYPDELSGGQKQRVALARAFAARPRLILCDEVVSALDVSVQASVLELLGELASQKHVALLFVTHDLAVVRSLADRVYVMRDGEVCESASTDRLFDEPTHDYTRELLAAVPQAHRGAGTA